MNIRNGMPASHLGADGWAKPWSGSNGGDCLEAKKLPGGRVAFASPPTPKARRSSWSRTRSPRSSTAPAAWPTTCSP